MFGKYSQALGGLSVNEFNDIITREQKGYLKDMQIPPGIAINAALLENVFVVMVCILNKIPIFVVGKPGFFLPIIYFLLTLTKDYRLQ